MSLHPQEIPPVPEETRRVAQAAFPRGNLYMRMRDELGAIYDDHCSPPLFPARGQPAASPWRLALTTVLQYVEGLSDRQAADAVRGRIDWKYALSLELTDPGFDHTVLSEFRSRLVAGQAEQLLLDTFLTDARTRPAQGAGPAAHRLDPCPGGHSRPQPAGAGRRDPAPRPEQPRRGRPGLAAGPGPGGVVRPLWPPHRELPPAQDRRGPRGAGGDHRGRWPPAAAGGRCRDGPALAAQIPAVQTLRQVWAEQYTDPPGPLRWRAVKERALPPR